MTETTIFRRSLAPRLDELPRVRHDLRCWLKQLEVPRSAADDIVLAAWEICANAIEHPAPIKHPGQQIADVTIVGEARPHGIRLAVRDQGASSGAAFSRPNRGLGLRIVEGVVDRLAIRRGLGETEIVLFRGTRHTTTGDA